MNPRHFFAVTAFAACALHAFAADPFATGVRTTEPLAPTEQQKTFKLPPGFEIQLIAAEPELRKPMNMAFDAAGRLWVTESREYPFAAKLGEPARDSVRVFSEFDAQTGRAGKMEIFAEGLNIPIGLHPFLSPSSLTNAAARGLKPAQTWKCVFWSIPNIWLMEDTDGDGKADKREVLFGPLGFEKDTHGNQASFRRGFDGWIYATHGFNNTSTFNAKDGSTITLNSGNTYRFRRDGSRVEQHTWGQVNPFGMCLDPLGNFYTADCHSSPIYQLIRGGYYPSFGKPHDGLGYAPTVIQHSHGSTAICGAVYISDPSWPAEFRDNILIGNVMTSRINRDQITFAGSSPKGKELPDFLSTTDPWFRPVDLQFGPDGALYIADFYNRIIGHYEVPLLHPGRDRERGRLWRVVRKTDQLALPKDFNLVKANTDELITNLKSKNPTRHSLAMSELEQRADAKTLGMLQNAARGQWFCAMDERPGLITGALWVLHRRGALEEETLLGAAKDRETTVRVHALRILSETSVWKPAAAQSVLNALTATNPFVQRAAAEALSLHPAAAHVAPLLNALSTAPATDAHFVYVLRRALREQFRAPDAFARLDKQALPEADARAIADIAASVASPDAASFLFRHLRSANEPAETFVRHLRHIVRHASEKELDAVTGFAREKSAADLDLQTALFKSVQEGAAQRGTSLTPATIAWGAELAGKLLVSTGEKSTWANTPPDGATDKRSPWAFQERACADGQKAQVISSLPNGEQLIGTLRSAKFPLPAKLSFYLCGHDGPPGNPAQKKNTVRLRDATTRAVLREAAPPRSDTAQKISWTLADIAGKEAFIEITDGDTGTGFAWLAFGRFEPALPQLVLNSPTQLGQRQQAGAELARALKVKSLEGELAKLLANSNGDTEARDASARALLSLNSKGHLAGIGQLATNAAAPPALRGKLALALAEVDLPEASAFLIAPLRDASRGPQVALATAMAGTPSGAERLLVAVESKLITAQLLLEKPVKERLAATGPAKFNERFAKLTQGVTPSDGSRQKLIDQRRAAFATAKSSAEAGAKIYATACAACHRIGNEGGLVGPQLDGIGGRGLERLIEDILDPNRNVDHAFRTTVFLLKDGESVSGLFRREEGATIVYALANGQEARVAKTDVKTRRESELSLMPENFGEAMPARDFNDLLAFLLGQTK